MRGHHPESCPRRVLQQGGLWVDTSRASGQRVRRVVQGLRAVKMGGAPELLIYPNVKKGDHIFFKRFTVMPWRIEIWVTLMNFFINELSEKCHERCCARPNHLWGHPKCSLGGPGPQLSGPILLWYRPGRGKPLFWPLGAVIPQQAKTKVAKKAPNLNQRRGWLGGIPKGAWEPRGAWAEPALALGNPLTHNQDKKVH